MDVVARRLDACRLSFCDLSNTRRAPVRNARGLPAVAPKTASRAVDSVGMGVDRWESEPSSILRPLLLPRLAVEESDADGEAGDCFDACGDPDNSLPVETDIEEEDDDNAGEDRSERVLVPPPLLL